jgi:hypothetical protein
LIAGEHVIELARDQTWNVAKGNLLGNPGFEQGLEGWRFDKTVASLDRTGSRSGKQCIKFSGDLTDNGLAQTVDFEVRPESVCRLSYWMRGELTKGRPGRYGGAHSLGQSAVALGGFAMPVPWFIGGNEWHETEWRQFEHWAFSPPHEPGESITRRMLVEPFRLHKMWGESEGTIWIDDVQVADLGPRLRPVKVTKLLVTNVAGYTPAGLDGRQAYPFPPAPRIAVAGLRCTARTSRSITLAWSADRAGGRGYSVYANSGEECPATKYYQVTSVWGRTVATLDALDAATTYTVQVKAINEDGIEGPAASLRAATRLTVARSNLD